MKLRMRLFILVVFSLAILACDNSSEITIKGSWKVAEKKVTLRDINYVDLYAPGDLYVETDKMPELRMEADDNLLPYFFAKEVNGKLEILSEKGVKIGGESEINPPANGHGPLQFDRKAGVNLKPRRRIKYYLKANTLEGISSWNYANVIVENMEVEKFTIMTGSSGFTMGKLTATEVSLKPGGGKGNKWYDPRMRDMRIKAVYAEKLNVEMNSNQNVKIDGGEVNRQEIFLNNQGDYDAHNMNCITAEVYNNGTGSVTIRVSEKLIVYLYDYSGDVYYLGEPEIKEIRTSEASGKLIKIKE